MQFDSWSSLWFGLSLPAIVLLYLFKRKYVDTPVSSHLLWNRVLKDMEANRPWQKLRNRLLMIVQLLAAALLVIALMQPWVWSQRAAKAHVVVVLDKSASMTARFGTATGGNPAGSRLDESKRHMLEWIEREAANSAITLIAMGEQAEVVLSRETDSARLREAVAQIQPAYGKTAYKEAMSLAAALTRTDPNSEIQLFTDGQFAEPVTGLSFAVPVTVQQLPNTASDSNANVSISQFGVRTVRESGGGMVAAVGSLKNWGDSARQVEVSLYAGGDLAAVQTVSVEPGKQASVYFERLAAADWYKLDIGANDSLRIDNVSYAFLEGDRPKNVLLVGDGNLFLEKALQLAGSQVTKLAPDGMAAWIRSHKPESGPNAVVIDSVAGDALASAEWRSMLDTKPVLYIRSGYEGKEIAAPTGPYTIEEHTVTRYIKLLDTHISSVFQTAQLEWGKPIVSAKDVPLVYAGAENGQPRLLFAFALQQSDLPLRTEFPVLIQNALGWLTAAQGGSLGRAVAGDRKEMAMSPGTATAQWIRVDDNQEAIEAERRSGRLASVQTIPRQPGLYRFEEKDESGNSTQIRWLSVSADSRESGISQTKLDFTTEAADNSGGTGQQTNAVSGAPHLLWRWIVLLLLAVVVLEWGVYRRGASV